MAHRRTVGPIRRRSPALTDDQITRDRLTAWLASRSSLIADEEPSEAAMWRYVPSRPAGVVLQPPEVLPPPVTARRSHMLPWWDYLTHIVQMVGGDDPVFTTVYARNHEPGCPTLFPAQYGVKFEQIWWPWADVTTIVAISEFHPADYVAKRSAVEATLKELWGKAGIVVPDFQYFKLKAHEAGDATITTTAVTVSESFKHSSVAWATQFVARRHYMSSAEMPKYIRQR
ncbi:hypothetical protein ACP4OV_014387 [Aristida adscensionis]